MDQRAQASTSGLDDMDPASAALINKIMWADLSRAGAGGRTSDSESEELVNSHSSGTTSMSRLASNTSSNDGLYIDSRQPSPDSRSNVENETGAPMEEAESNVDANESQRQPEGSEEWKASGEHTLPSFKKETPAPLGSSSKGKGKESAAVSRHRVRRRDGFFPDPCTRIWDEELGRMVRSVNIPWSFTARRLGVIVEDEGRKRYARIWDPEPCKAVEVCEIHLPPE